MRKIKGPMENTSIGPEQKWALMTPDGSKIVNETGGPLLKTFIVRSSATGKLISEIPKAGGWMQGVPLSPDGRFLVTRIHSMRSPTADVVNVWDLDTGLKVSDLAEPGHSAMVMVFSPDGKTIAGSVLSPEETSDANLAKSNRIVVWDVETGKVLRQRALDKDRAAAPVFSADGRTLAAAIDGAVHLYDAGSLDETTVLTGGSAQIAALAFSPDGRRLAAGDGDGRVRMWDIGARKLLIAMIGFTSRDDRGVSQDWLAYTPDGYYDWSPGAASLIRWRYAGKLYPANAFASLLRRKDLLVGK